MPKKTDDDDDIEFLAGADQDDDITAQLRAALEDGGEGEDDDGSGGFEIPLDDDNTKDRETISEEDGTKRIEKARYAKPAATKVDKTGSESEEGKEGDKAKGELPDDAAAAGGDAPADADKGAKPGDERAEDVDRASDEDLAKAIESLSPGVRKRIAEDREALGKIMAPLRGREAELEARGVDAAGAMQWFLNVNDYAGREPGNYAAWALQQSVAGDATKLEAEFKKTAAALGFKVERAAPAGGEDEDDDPFMTDRERELAAENRRLRAAQQGEATPQIGPDAPEERTRRIVLDVMTETGADGLAKYPHFDVLMDHVTQILGDKVQKTGTSMTRDDLIEAYETAELAHPKTRQAALDRLIAARSAAQKDAGVREGVKKQTAAAAKAESASSKILDGPSHGANRQPADEDADLGLEDFLRKQFDKQISG